MEQEDLGVRAVEMLIKNIVKIERGTMIKGLTIKPFGDCVKPNETSRPRIATLNVDGWVYTNPNFECKSVRTIFYSHSSKPSWVEPVSSEMIDKFGINKFLVEDPWMHWMDYKFIEFNKDEPIGVHLGEFIIGQLTKKRKSYVNFYTKILLINGDVGYLTLETENKRSIEAELI